MMADWQFVMNQLGTGGYWPGLDPNREYEFKRLGEEKVMRFKLADQSPYFNVFNLFWREPQ